MPMPSGSRVLITTSERGESKITSAGSSYLGNVFSCTTRPCTKVDEMIQLLPTVCKTGRMESSEAVKSAITREE